MNLEAFTPDHLDGAAALLAERHARHREHEPRLPARYEDPATARAEIERLLEADADGIAAVRDGRVVAYLLGTRSSDEVWGPNVWVEVAGHAADRAEDVRDLYAAAAAGWVERGRKAHYAVVPASDQRLVDAWFRLAFGQQHAYGIRALDDAPIWPERVRVAAHDDLDALVSLAPLLSQHQELSPVFAGWSSNDTEDELRAEVEDDLANPKIGNLVADVDGRIVGNFVIVPVERSRMHVGLARPERAAHLGWAATLPEVRGTGSGRALTEAAFSWAYDRGYRVMVTDWRMTNLLSSRFWPARGFRPTFLRLHRLVA